MQKQDPKYTAYIQILEEELVPAMGCTEPIALAYAAAVARDTLGCMPEAVTAKVSGSIIKNVKSVIVPNTDHLKGIPAAITAGIVAGQADRELEVIAHVTAEQIERMRAFLDAVPITTEHVDNGFVFEIDLKLHAGDNYARVRIVNFHTNIVLVEKDGQVIRSKDIAADTDDAVRVDRSLLSIESIWDFATTVDVADVEHVLDRQIRYNTAIADEGLRGDWGANIGKVLLAAHGNDVRNRAKARAAAGSDARMNGCELPVIINSGSGNQGITCSVPVIEYAEELKVGREKLLRALVLSNLTAIHQKTGIGTLSAYCGAVSAATGAGAAIAYLCGGGYKEVIHTVVNSVSIVSGMVCDGAKASCAAKIASSVDAAILGYEMYQHGQQFRRGDGLITGDVESTIRSIGQLGKEGMRETNNEIIRLMVTGC